MNTGDSQASDPSAFLEGLCDDPDLVTALRDFRRSIAEYLQVNATAPVTQNPSTATRKPEASEIRRDNHQIGITVQKPISTCSASEQDHPVHADLPREPTFQGFQPADDLGSCLATQQGSLGPHRKMPTACLGCTPMTSATGWHLMVNRQKISPGNFARCSEKT